MHLFSFLSTICPVIFSISTFRTHQSYLLSLLFLSTSRIHITLSVKSLISPTLRLPPYSHAYLSISFPFPALLISLVLFCASPLSHIYLLFRSLSPETKNSLRPVFLLHLSRMFPTL